MTAARVSLVTGQFGTVSRPRARLLHEAYNQASGVQCARVSVALARV